MTHEEVMRKVESFQKIVGEEVRNDFGYFLGMAASVEIETVAYWNREFPVLVLDNGIRIDISYMDMAD